MLHSRMAGLEWQSFLVSQRPLDLLDEHIGVGGFDDNLVEACLLRTIELPAMRVAGRRNEGNELRVGIRAQMPRDIEPRDDGQFEVEHNQIRHQSLGLPDGGGAIAGRRDAIAFRSETERPDVERIRVVVHDQNVLARTHRHTSLASPFQAPCQTDPCEGRATLFDMTPNLAQVLNTLAHEIRTPLAVSQGYLKLLLDGRLTNEEDTRRAMEQTRQALGALATLCMDMGKVSALTDNAHLREAASAGQGVDTAMTVPVADVLANLRTLDELKDAAWETDEAKGGAIKSANYRDLAHAVAITAKAAFDEDRHTPHLLRAKTGDNLIVLAGSTDALAALQDGPAAPASKPVDFSKGGKGLKLIWASFVLEGHGVQTWTSAQQRASVGFRIPLVQA